MNSHQVCSVWKFRLATWLRIIKLITLNFRRIFTFVVKRRRLPPLFSRRVFLLFHLDLIKLADLISAACMQLRRFFKGGGGRFMGGKRKMAALGDQKIRWNGGDRLRKNKIINLSTKMEGHRGAVVFKNKREGEKKIVCKYYTQSSNGERTRWGTETYGFLTVSQEDGERKRISPISFPTHSRRRVLKKSCWGGDLNGGSGNVERAICYELW